MRAISAEPEAGRIYRGAVVTGLAAFGAFVEILPGNSGLVHVSELDHGGVASVEAFCAEGDVLDVMLMEVLDNGKMKLSRRAVQVRFFVGRG